MDIKLFASDMDGTLLNEFHVISDRTADAVKRLQALGVEFLIATGRDYKPAKILTEAQGIHCSFVNSNGADIRTPEGKSVITVPIERSSLEEARSYLTSQQIDYGIMTLDGYYTTNYDVMKERMKDFYESKPQNRTAMYDEITDAQIATLLNDSKDITEFNIEQHVPLKVMVYHTHPETLDRLMQELSKDPKIAVTSSGIENLEINHVDAQKGFAIERYIKEKGYTMDQVVSIGDALNDRSMLELAGTSYAMANATPEVQAYADHIAPKNTEDGVAVVIEQLIKQLEK
ncbi:Cof-type HAD-IIB family hydrolase [Dolosicoccus paucivorans]|uniref:Cof-type HAD-IIB family hydrolase n=1 Tax=Dolosicoccus paucivorans TaxID=84521 RepID=UPI00088BDF32|nr:Cof-type HAD-IIB family hydrolase [Dolosicoccus paucivorans]SDI38233.1 hypothetical protein SAMN04487994_10092 [Dolosicoccus paucivorans]